MDLESSRLAAGMTVHPMHDSSPFLVTPGPRNVVNLVADRPIVPDPVGDPWNSCQFTIVKEAPTFRSR